MTTKDCFVQPSVASGREAVVSGAEGAKTTANAEAAEWFQNDARYLRKCEAEYLASGDAFMVERVRIAAAHSEARAKDFLSVAGAAS